jgi:hypothetical protein
MHWYSIGPGFPEQAASTAQALAITSLGRGKTVSFLHEGGFTGILFIFFLFGVGKQKGLAKTEMSMRLGVELQGHAHYVK